MKRNLFFLFLLLTGMNAVGQTNYFDSHPYAAALSLGKSFDIYNTSNIIGSEIFKEFKARKSNEENSKIFISILTSKEAVMKTLRIDGNLDATFDLDIFSAGLNWGVDISEKSIFASNSVTLCLSAVTDYGNEIIKDPKLSDEAIRLLNSPQLFKQKFGEYYVSGQKREQIVYLFITINNISEEYKREIIANIGGGLQVPILFDGQISYNFNSIIEKSKKIGRVNEAAIIFGKNTYSSVPDLVSKLLLEYETTHDYSVSALKALSEYMDKNFEYKNSSTTRYFYSPLSQFGYRDDLYFDRENRKFEKYSKIKQLYSSLKNLERKINLVKTSPLYDMVSPYDEDLIQAWSSATENNLDKLSESIALCKGSSCDDYSNCCKSPVIDEQEPNIIVDELFAKYNFPFKDLIFTARSEISVRTNLKPSPIIIQMFSQTLAMWNLDCGRISPGIPNGHRHKYKIKGEIYLSNDESNRYNYAVDVLINNSVVLSGGPTEVSSRLWKYTIESEEYNFDRLFNEFHIQMLTVQVRPLYDNSPPYIMLHPNSYLSVMLVD